MIDSTEKEDCSCPSFRFMYVCNSLRLSNHTNLHLRNTISKYSIKAQPQLGMYRSKIF